MSHQNLGVKKSLLITGASGFVGQNLIRSWETDSELELQPVSLRNGLRAFQSVIDTHPYAVLHLAGKAHDTGNTSDPASYFEVNSELTKRVFDGFLKSKVSLFIYFSSVKAVADRVKGQQLTEEAPPQPGTPYGESKLEAERYLLSKELPPDKSMYILRPCMMHGPGNKGNLNLLYKIVSKGIPWPLGAFENQRSFLAIDNLIFLLGKLVEGGIPSGIYNLADDNPLSTSDLIRIIAEVEDRKARILNIPTGLLRITARLGDLTQLPLNSERLKKLTESYVVDNRKIKEALGIRSFPVSTAEGLRKTISSFHIPS